MSKEAVAMIILSGDGTEVVLGKKIRKEESFLSELWHLPGETKNPGEKDLDAVKRGALEELGIKVNGFIYLESNTTLHGTSLAWYEVMVFGQEKLTTGSDLSEAKWVDIDKVKEIISPEASALWPERVKKYFGIT